MLLKYRVSLLWAAINNNNIWAIDWLYPLPRLTLGWIFNQFIKIQQSQLELSNVQKDTSPFLFYQCSYFCIMLNELNKKDNIDICVAESLKCKHSFRSGFK